MEIYGSRNKEKCHNVKNSTSNSSITTTKESMMESLTSKSISLDTNTPLKTSSNSPCIRDLENFKDSQSSWFFSQKKARGENNLHICQQLFLSQKEHIACLENTISHPRGELDCKQKVINNLLETLKSCLYSNQRGMTKNILFYKINHPISIKKMLIKVILQSALIKKQLISLKKPSTTIKNEIKNVSLFLTNTVIRDTLMTSLKRQNKIQLIMANHGEIIIKILKQ